MSHRRVAALLVLGFALVSAAWMLTTPLEAGPDEPSHYVRALAVGGGHLLGTPARFNQLTTYLTPVERSYLDSATRREDIPARLAPRNPVVPCFAFQPDVSAGCAAHTRTHGVNDTTYVGTYQPVYYVLPGLAARLFGSPASGLRAARLASGLLCLMLLALAVAYARGFTGLLLATSPMVLALTGTVSSSAFEVTSAMAFVVTSIAMIGGDGVRPRLGLLWTIAGVCLAWSRPLGPVWIVATVLAVGVALSETPVRKQLRAHALALSTVGLACLGSLAWDVLVGIPGVTVRRAGLLHQLHVAIKTFHREVREQVGVFGWLDSSMPRWAYTVWVGAIGALLVLALIRGRWRQRLAIGIALVVYVGSVLLVSLEQQAEQFDAQGRYTLPALLLVVLLAGEVLRRDRRVLVAAAAVFASINLTALYENGRRYAVGSGGRTFYLFNAAWRPPGGWALWAVVSLAGIGLVVAGALLAPLRPEPQAG